MIGGMRRASPALLIFLWLLLPAPAPAAEPAFALVNPGEAEALARQKPSAARAQAIRFADRVLGRLPHAMTRVHVEGTLPHHGIHDESREALRDFPAARDLALAARLTGDARYGQAAARFIAAWTETYRPSFNPIDETGFDALILAFDLLPDVEKAPLAEPARRFWRTLAKGYLDRMPTLEGGTATNNWQSHRVKLATLAAFAAGEPDLVARARQAYAAQLAANLRPDGSCIDFAQRDAIHYVVYDLEPLAAAALAARRHGEDWYALAAPSGAALPRSLDWLAPYADGRLRHAEFLHTTVRFDEERREAGLAGFAGDFDAKAARDLFAMAARLDARYAALSRKLGSTGPWLDLLWPLP